MRPYGAGLNRYLLGSIWLRQTNAYTENREGFQSQPVWPGES